MREYVEGIVADAGQRKHLVSLLRECVQEAARLDASRWAVQATRTGKPYVYLHVGHHRTSCIETEGLWLALDRETAREFGIDLTAARSYWQPDTGEWATYGAIESDNGYYVPGPKHEVVWPILRALHFASLRKAAKYKALDQSGVDGHSPELLDYIRSEAEVAIAEPSHQAAARD